MTLHYPPDYIGYWGGKQHYSPGEPIEPFMSHFPMTICAAKCGRWFRKVSVDVYDGLCCFCHREQFAGEPDMTL